MFEDQVFLAKLYLTQRCVISGAQTARYRRHQGSSTALAIEQGTYDPGATQPQPRELSPVVGSASPGADRCGQRRAGWSLLAGALAAYDRDSSTRRSARAVLVKAIPPRRASPAPRLPPVGSGRSGRCAWVPFARLQPLSRQFGFDRGLPVDRYYIEQFLAEHAHLIAGRVLEVGDSAYTRRFGGERVSQADVLNIDPLLPETTIVADLASADHVAVEQLRLPGHHPDPAPAVRPHRRGADPAPHPASRRERSWRRFPASARSARIGGPSPGTGR